MIKKTSQIVFICLFLSMLTIPMLCVNLKRGQFSGAEKRLLAGFPDLYTAEGCPNSAFSEEFETWLNDHIGFRLQMVATNAKIQYYIFGLLSNNSNMYLGPNGEFNYATPSMLKDYQHVNLYSSDKLAEIAAAYQTISDYTDKQGAVFYYYQCWDKHSIYPEYFPQTVFQRGDKSKTDGVLEALHDQTDVRVISPKQTLLAGKAQYESYSRWGDATHWTPRGAYMGYCVLMNALNADRQQPFHVLSPEEYVIEEVDMGDTVLGCIRKEDIMEQFTLRDPHAMMTRDKLTLYAGDSRNVFYTNESAGNQTRLLVVGDSYFGGFIMDDLAESFYETVLIWGDYCADIGNIIDTYHPDIVVVEAAERVDRSEGIIEGAQLLQTEE